MDFETRVRLGVYRYFVERGERPSAADVAELLGVNAAVVLETYGGLAGKRMLVLDSDGESIRMAPPFSGVETQHVIVVDGRSYFANCAWDAFGIIAALHKPGVVHSRCGQSSERLHLALGPEGPERSDWLFHCPVPASHWWDDIVFT